MIHPSLAAFDLLDILQLIRSENVGPVTFFQLIRRFGTPRKALAALPDLAVRGGMKRKLTVASRQSAEKEIQLTEKFGATFLRYGDTDYPALLTEIPDAPPLLMQRGRTDLWQGCAPDRMAHSDARTERPREPSAREAVVHCASSRRAQGQLKRTVAIIGSRNASVAGTNFTRKLARECGERGLTVVSGLARGIDTAAHRGALESGTVGVIAGGIDNIYPPENQPLFDALAERGAILSENPFGASPQSRHFPGRNRIIAGMCEGLVVVEAAPQSGSLITARFGLDYNREVMAVPGSPLDPRSKGANGLLKQGAVLIESAEDILQALQRAEWQQPARMQEQETPDFSAVPADTDALDETRRTLEEKLGVTPIQLDELAWETQIPIALIQSALLEMELAGRIVRYPGGKVALCYDEEKPEPQAALF